MANRWASRASSVGRARRSQRPPLGCCLRPRPSIRWPSPGPPSGWPCAPRPRPASSGGSTPSGSTGQPNGSASWWWPARPGRGWRPGCSTSVATSPPRCGSPWGRTRSTGCSGRSCRRARWPSGFRCTPAGGDRIVVVVPTNRPDVRPEPHGVADLAEEVARLYGYSRIERRRPTWATPGGLSTYQAERRRVREVLVGLGADEVWTSSLVDERDEDRLGVRIPPVRITNPMAADQAALRRTQMGGLLRALAWNRDRRQGDLRLFEVGVVFWPPDPSQPPTRAGSEGGAGVHLPVERELVSAVFAADGDDAAVALSALHALAEELRVADLRLRPQADGAALPGLHPSRSAVVRSGRDGPVVGTVGELDPAVVAEFGAASGRVGWLELDLRTFLHRDLVSRRPEVARPVSRYPSADVDVALSVDDAIPADLVADALRGAGGELLESVTLFDVFRGPGVGPGRRSLAFRLRFCAADRTLTDAEVGELRARCVAAAEDEVGASLR